MSGDTRTAKRRNGWTRLKRPLAGITAAVLAGGTLVIAGLGVQSAMAAVVEPIVSTTGGTVVAGEDTTISVTFENPASAPGTDTLGLYNLSAGLLLPEGVSVVGGYGRLGAPVATYTHAA